MADGNFGHIDSLPDDIRDVFMWLCQDVAALYRIWDFYTELFGKPQNFGLLTHLPGAFNVIEGGVRTDITMSLCRLSDPVQSCGRDNLNFRALGTFYNQDSKLQSLIDEFVAACGPVKVNRNKLVGHSDRIARLSPGQAMIPQIKKSDIDSALEKAIVILNHVSWTYGGHTFGFGFPGDGGAGGLTYWLKKSIDNRLKHLSDYLPPDD